MERPQNVYQYLVQIRPRLPMYIGRASILNLEHYLYGYVAALQVHGIEEGDAPSFHQFSPWIWLTRKAKGNCGWGRAILDLAGSEEAALDLFFTLAAEFGQLRVVAGETLDLAMGPGGRAEAQHRPGFRYRCRPRQTVHDLSVPRQRHATRR